MTGGTIATIIRSSLHQDRFPRRFVQLWCGLVFYGISMVLLLRSRLGLDPWDVFHQGLSNRLHLPFGNVVIAVSVLVLLLWIPLRQRPGIGTICNAFAVGLVVDAVLPLLAPPSSLPLRVLFLLAGILINGMATALYIGAGLGPGPRDGLMMGLARRGYPIRRARTGIELSVLAAGWILGGTVGIGTVLYAVSIGPLIHLFLPRLTVKTGSVHRRTPVATTAAGPQPLKPCVTE